MVNFKTALKVSLVSMLLVAGSMVSTARADHNRHSIFPYVAIGVFASILYNHAHSHRYHYKKKHRHGHSGHYGQNSYYGQGGYNGGHYGSHYQYSHNSGGYRYKTKRH